MSKHLLYQIDDASDAPKPSRRAVASLVLAIVSCPLFLMPALRAICGVASELEQTYMAHPPKGGLGAIMLSVLLTTMGMATLLPVVGLVHGRAARPGSADRSVLWTALVLALLWWPFLLVVAVGIAAGGRF